MNARRAISTMAALLVMCMGFGTFAQVPSDVNALRDFLDSLRQPILALAMTIPANPNRPADTWTNPDPANVSMPDVARLTSMWNDAAAVPSEPGRFVAVAGDGSTHIFRAAGSGASGQVLGGADNAVPPGQTCSQAASGWYQSVAGAGNAAGVRGAVHVIVFDHRGVMCAREGRGPRITQGDILYVGLFGPPEEIYPLRRKIPDCSLEGTAPNILDPNVGIRFDAGAGKPPELRQFPPFECFDDEIEVQFIRDNNSIAFTDTLRQYKRYRATFQIGALWTTLADPAFALTDFGDGPVIRNTVDDSRGPEYMASLVVYGAPHYLGTLWGGDRRYSGRDIVNDNSFADRVGLFLAFGLSDPEDTLGIGLSFELASGINLTVTQLYRRIAELDGLSEGDPFSGTAQQIPTVETWKDEVAVGLSIDGRYLTKFFGGNTGE